MVVAKALDKRRNRASDNEDRMFAMDQTYR